jgi:hypothetical protein
MNGRTATAVLGLITIGGAFVVPFGIRTDLAKWVTLPNWFFSLMLLLGVLSLVAAALVPIASALMALRPVRKVFTCELVKAEDIDRCYALFQEQIPAELPPVERVRTWHRKCPGSFRQVWTERRKAMRVVRDLVGCFHVAPVTAATVAQLEKNTLLGSQFQESHIASSYSAASGLYIGAIAATSSRARHYTLLMLLGYVSSLASSPGRPIYARLLPPDGKRLGLKYGFVPVVSGASNQNQLVYRKII